MTSKKETIGPMLGLKSFRTADVLIGATELAARIKKNRFQIGKRAGQSQINVATGELAPPNPGVPVSGSFN
jgi:hypothetical protein